jgi:hypothetical protein
MDEAYQRHLPHQVPEGVPIFLTWNLKGALPKRVLEELQRKRQELEREPRRAGETLRARKIRHGKIVFGIADRYLDMATSGPMHLKDARAAQTVVDSALFGVEGRYDLYA